MLKTRPLEITNLPIAELKPDPANPRRISDEELESLTRSYGLRGVSAAASCPPL